MLGSRKGDRKNLSGEYLVNNSFYDIKKVCKNCIK
jgi:hypothetical protein